MVMNILVFSLAAPWLLAFSASNQEKSYSDLGILLKAIAEQAAVDHSFSILPKVTIETCTQALTSQTERPRAILPSLYMRRGIAHGVLGDFHSASRDMLCTLRVDPSNEYAACLYASFLLMKGKTQESIWVLDIIYRQNPTAEIPFVLLAGLALQKGKALECITLCERALTNAKLLHYRALTHYLRAQAFYILQMPDRCLDDVETAIRLVPLIGAPSPEQPYILKSKCLTMIGRHDEALVSSFMAKHLNPKSLDALRACFDAHQSQEKYYLCAVYAKEMCICDPNDLRSLTTSAASANLLSDHRHALELAERVLRRNEEHAQALREAGIACQGMGNEDRANLYYRRALAVGPADASSLRLLAKFLASTGSKTHRDVQGALKYAMQACWLTKDKDAECLRVLAMCHAEAAQFEQALGALQKALLLAPASSKFRLELQKELELYRRKHPENRVP